MSHILDTLERVTHGTPAGFADGCKARGACPNHESRTLLTCADAERARLRNYDLGHLAPTEEITRHMIRLARRHDRDALAAIIAARTGGDQK